MTSPRNVWIRPLAGSTRDGVTYYWSTSTSPVPGWVTTEVPLLLSDLPGVPAAALDPLGTIAADTALSWSCPSSLGALAVSNPDLSGTAQARRVGFLAAYVEAADDTIEVAYWTGVPGQQIQVGHEVMTAGTLSGTTLPVTRTAADRQDHNSPLLNPTPILRADRTPLVGQYLEFGFTDSAGDSVVWRGQVTAINASPARLTFTARSLLAVVREHATYVPESVRFASTVYRGRRAAMWDLGVRKLVRWQEDPGEYPNSWGLVRIISTEGDWFIVATDTALAPFNDPGYRPGLYIHTDESEILAIGGKDGPIRVTGVGSSATIRGAGGTTISVVIDGEDAAKEFMRIHAESVLDAVSHTELAVLETSARASDLVANTLVRGTLPAGWTVGFPSSWLDQSVFALQTTYEPTGWPTTVPYLPPKGSLTDWLADSVIAVSGFYLSEDRGVLVLDTWAETARPTLPNDLDAASCIDRGVWAWESESIEPLAYLTIEDTSLSVSFTLKATAGIRRGRIEPTYQSTHRENIANSRTFVAADRWANGSRSSVIVPAAMGASEDQAETLNGLLQTFSQQIPAVTVTTSEVGRAVGYAIAVQLPDLPVTRRTIGMVYRCARNPGAGTVTLTILLPGIGREQAIAWAPTLTVVDAGTGEVSGDTDSVYPTTVTVWNANGVEVGTLTGFALTGDTITYGTGSVSDGDMVSLPPRPPVAGVPGADMVYGYVGSASVAPGDGRWQ